MTDLNKNNSHHNYRHCMLNFGTLRCLVNLNSFLQSSINFLVQWKSIFTRRSQWRCLKEITWLNWCNIAWKGVDSIKQEDGPARNLEVIYMHGHLLWYCFIIVIKLSWLIYYTFMVCILYTVLVTKYFRSNHVHRFIF